MLHLLERVADRLVGVVAPRATAGACICSSDDNWWEFCYCGSPPGTPYYRLHEFDCTCHVKVSACRQYLTNICL